MTKCSCPNCGVHVEFDASELGPHEVRKGPCPACGSEMSFFDNSKKSVLMSRLGVRSTPQPAQVQPAHDGLGRSSTRLTILKFALLASVVGFLAYWAHWEVLVFQHKREQVQQQRAAEEEQKAAEASRIPENGGFLPDTNCPVVEKSYEIRESGWKSSTIITTCSVKYVNLECLEFSRWVKVEPGQEIVKRFIALKHGAFDNPLDEAEDGAGNSNKSDMEREQKSWDAYARQLERSSYFRVMRRDADNISQWISKCQKWSQIARSEHLADGITNTFDTCSFLACYGGYDVKSSIGFVTPDTLIIGDFQWSRKQMVELVGLTALLPQLDVALKEAINAKEAEDLRVKKERQDQLQAQQNEINRARELLR